MEGAATGQAVDAFTEFLHAGNKSRNPSFKSGREMWALACRTQPFYLTSLSPEAWILYPGLGFCILLPLSDSQILTGVINIPPALL